MAKWNGDNMADWHPGAESSPCPPATSSADAREAANPEAKTPPARFGVTNQVLRLIGFMDWFFSCCFIVHTFQLIAALLYFVSKDRFYTAMTYTKQQFGVILTTVTQWFTPTTIRISGDSGTAPLITQNPDGRLITDFPERLVLISNHQIYTEWLYLWWIAYTSGRHGDIYIILKQSLKYIPVLGWAMQLYGFIFMARNWATDQARLAYRLRKLKASHSGPLSGTQILDPMWLLIFPEGTNLSAKTRKRSKAWAEKQGMDDLKNLLLPRSTGLQFCLQELKGTVEWVYDCTIAYEGVPRGGYAQDIFTLRSTFLAGRPPKSVNMYWRRIAFSSIPIDSDAQTFAAWLLDQWRRKEALIDYFHDKGTFPPNPAAEKGWIETEVRLGSLWEILHVYVATACVSAVIIGMVGAYNKRIHGKLMGLG